MTAKQWVIPDVHGCYYTLKKLLEDRINITKEDTVYFLGDLVDRGKHSRLVLDYLINLEKEGYNIKVIKGNHEEYFVRSYYSELTHNSTFLKKYSKDYQFWLKVGGKETVESFGVKNVKDIPLAYIKWIENLPYYYLTDKYVIVHAGLNFNKKNPFEDTNAMLVNNHFTVVPEKIGNRTVIHGHIPLSIDGIETLIREKDTYHFICLDNGCYYEKIDTFGSLLALNLDTLELTQQPNIED
ncbi:MAG TPA: metallophosphoesterase family protein [Bacteroidales bacterium]|jgi:serine/threonine protein phosphatase 1|nr:metallophosphoesterase family protein [Bacteroidales bacterium]